MASDTDGTDLQGDGGVDPASRAALARLELVVTRRLDGVLLGDHRGLVPGPGTESGEAREYQPGDDVRAMDWSVTARTTVPHIRRTIADRELETWIVVDLGPGIDAVGSHGDKRSLVLAAVATVGFLASSDGNRIGLVLASGDGVRVFRAAAGPDHVRRLLEKVAHAPAGTGAGAVGFAAALESARTASGRRGLLVLVSDFLGPADWDRPLRALTGRHELLAVHVADPLDIALPVVGSARLQDPATGEILEVEVDRRMSAEYREVAGAHRRVVHGALRHCGAPVLALRTDRDWVRDVIDHIGVRRRGGLPNGELIERDLPGSGSGDDDAKSRETSGVRR